MKIWVITITRGSYDSREKYLDRAFSSRENAVRYVVDKMALKDRTSFLQDLWAKVTDPFCTTEGYRAYATNELRCEAMDAATKKFFDEYPEKDAVALLNSHLWDHPLKWAMEEIEVDTDAPFVIPPKEEY